MMGLGSLWRRTPDRDRALFVPPEEVASRTDSKDEERTGGSSGAFGAIRNAKGVYRVASAAALLSVMPSALGPSAQAVIELWRGQDQIAPPVEKR